MLAGYCAQREEPLLDFFELARIELELVRGRFECRERLGGFRGGSFGSRQRCIEESLGALAEPFQAARRASEGGLRAGVAVEFADRLVQCLGESFGALQQGAPGGEAVLFVFFRRQRIEFGQLVPQQVLFLAARREQPGRFGFALSDLAPFLPSLGERRRGHVMLGKGVEDRAMVGRIEQSALLELTLDLDEAVTELAQQPDARRFVVDKGTAAPIGSEHPPQHDRVPFVFEPGLAQDRMRRMVAPDRELRRYRRLLRPRPHQPSLRSLAERQAQRIEQDRFAGASLAGQHAKARTKDQVETVDQDNVTNIQAEQHCEPQIVAPNHISAAAAKPASVRPPWRGSEVTTMDKPELYRDLSRQLEALLAAESNLVANAANMAALIYHGVPDLNWAGFYFRDGAELVLGPFQGKPACVRIKIGEGVCGTAAARAATVLVPDVHKFPGHIACDPESRSELVVPLVEAGAVLGVLDLDSPLLAHFDERDRDGCEQLVALLLVHHRKYPRDKFWRNLDDRASNRR
jgi:L-methionine (R)-S-oxide reductase